MYLCQRYICVSQHGHTAHCASFKSILPVCRSYQTASRNSSSIVSGDIIKLFVSTESPSCHEFASQFGQAIFFTRKPPKNYRENRLSRKFLLNESGSGRKGAVLIPVTVDRAPTTSGNDNGHSGDL